MEVTQLNYTSGLQSSTPYAKDQSPESPRENVTVKVKDLEHLQSLLSKRQEMVQESRQSEGKKVETGSEQDRENLFELVKMVGEKLKSSRIRIEFQVNEDLGKIFMLIKDPVTDEVVRKVPPEEFEQLYQSLKHLQQTTAKDTGELNVKL